MMSEVAIYCRESTSKQDIDSLVSLCSKEARKLGFKDFTVYKDVKSGYSKEREGYNQLKEDIQDEKIKILIMYESSRITRDEAEYHIFYAMLKVYNVKVYTVLNGWLDLHNEDDLFFSAMMNLVDAREGRRTAKRVADRMREKAEHGEWVTGTPPLGYRLVNKKLVIFEEEALIVREIFNSFLQGKTRQNIAETLGLEVKKVRRILKNPVYTGKIRYGSKITKNKKRIEVKDPAVFPGKHKAIIDEAEFEMVQAKIAKIKREVPDKCYIFKNLVTCACGNKMYRIKAYNNYYHCSFRNDCSVRNIYENELFEEVMISLEKIILELDLENLKPAKTDQLTQQLNLYKSELKKLTDQEEKLVNQLLNNTISDNIYKKFYHEISNKKAYFSEKITEFTKKITSEKDKKKNSEVLKNYFKKIKKEKDPEKLNTFLSLIIEDIRFVNDYRFYINLKF